MSIKIWLQRCLPLLFLSVQAENGCGSTHETRSACSSFTFFAPRQITFDSTYELALADYNFFCAPCGWARFYVTPFYQQSRRSKKFGSYFLPEGREQITVRDNGLGDVNPNNFGIFTPNQTFNASLSLSPERRVAGVLLTAFFDFSCWCDGWWASIHTAAFQAQHKMNCLETGFSSSSSTCPTLFSTLCGALDNPAFTAGRFSSTTLKRGGLDDIQFKLGYNLWSCGCDHVGIYFLVSAPTGKKPQCLNIFEPLVGSRHASVGGGLNIGQDLNNWLIPCDDADLSLLLDLKYRYIIPAHECRTFDLTPNGDWSRFLNLTTSTDSFNRTLGVNVLTSPNVTISYHEINFWTALHYQYCNYGFEFGYNLWWRSKDKLSLKDTLNISDFAIFDLNGAATLNPASANTAQIFQAINTSGVPSNSLGGSLLVSDTTFTRLSSCNINLNSAAQPKAITHKIYLAGSYDLCWCDCPVLLGLAGSYEFARPKHNTLENWAVWGKIGFSF